jgi:signal transduction histidine kinase/CheY-like chemotaxis protein
MTSPGVIAAAHDRPAAGRLGRLSLIASWAALAIAAVALVSYPTGWALLRSAGRAIEVQVNDAVGVALAAAAVLLARRSGALARLAAGACALVAAALGGATLAEHALSVDLGIDQLLRHEAGMSPGVTSPGRMGPPASVSLLAIGASALLLAAVGARLARVAHALVLGVLPIALVGFVGHAYDVALLYGSPAANAIAAPTAAALLMLELAILLSHPERGLLASVTRPGAGSALARRMLGYALALPITLGGLVLVVAGAARGALAVSALVVAMTLVFAALVLRDAKVIDRLEAAKLDAQRERAASREELARALAGERDARAQAEAASRAKDQFLATLSHELRTPLNAILGWALLLRDGRGTPDRLGRGLAAIERNGRALAGVVSDLLDVSRMAAGTLEVAREPVDLRAAVERAVTALRPAAEARGVTLAAALPARAVTLAGDAARLEQVTWNVASNAVKLSARGARVDVSLRVEDGEAILEVSDRGPGLDAALLARVFEPFVQADGTASRAHGGLGIGLAITRSLVVAHGGRITAESEGAGRGATFRVALPGARLDAAPATPAGDLAGARVLVVDDEADSREVLLQLLASWGARPIGAASAREALDAWRRERPEVILSDIAMPGQDGLALVAELRRLEGPTHVPAAALTAFSRPEDRARALAAGFDAHLGKPIEPSVLRETLGRLVRAARAATGETPPRPPTAAVI